MIVVCVCVCVDGCVSGICLYVCICVCVCMHVYVCVYVCVYMYVCVCLCIMCVFLVVKHNNNDYSVQTNIKSHDYMRVNNSEPCDNPISSMFTHCKTAATN